MITLQSKRSKLQFRNFLAVQIVSLFSVPHRCGAARSLETEFFHLFIAFVWLNIKLVSDLNILTLKKSLVPFLSGIVDFFFISGSGLRGLLIG